MFAVISATPFLGTFFLSLGSVRVGFFGCVPMVVRWYGVEYNGRLEMDGNGVEWRAMNGNG